MMSGRASAVYLRFIFQIQQNKLKTDDVCNICHSQRKGSYHFRRGFLWTNHLEIRKVTVTYKINFGLSGEFSLTVLDILWIAKGDSHFRFC